MTDEQLKEAQAYEEAWRQRLIDPNRAPRTVRVAAPLKQADVVHQKVAAVIDEVIVAKRGQVFIDED